jgi:hypothetical protein
MHTRFFLSLLAAVMLAGCAGFPTRVQTLNPGMTRDEVVEVLGASNEYEFIGKGEDVHIYTNRRIAGQPGRADYRLRFVNRVLADIVIVPVKQ